MRLPGPVLAALFLAGCARNIDNMAAVKAAIEKRVVKTGFDLNAMNVNVTSVSFHGNDADATVAFVPKGGGPSAGATFNYKLQRQKEEWVVTGLSQGSMAGHTQGQSPPGGRPDSGIGGSVPGTGTSLPPGHPPIGTKP